MWACSKFGMLIVDICFSDATRFIELRASRIVKKYE